MSYVPSLRPIPRVDIARRPPMAGLGDACGPCTIQSGDACEICPDNAGPDYPECNGCVNGVRQTAVSAFTSSFFFPVVAGVATTLAVTYLSGKILGK